MCLLLQVMNNLFSIEELTGDRICELLALGHKLKVERGCHTHCPLTGQTWALIFSKSYTKIKIALYCFAFDIFLI